MEFISLQTESAARHKFLPLFINVGHVISFCYCLWAFDFFSRLIEILVEQQKQKQKKQQQQPKQLVSQSMLYDFGHSLSLSIFSPSLSRTLSVDLKVWQHLSSHFCAVQSANGLFIAHPSPVATRVVFGYFCSRHCSNWKRTYLPENQQILYALCVAA